MACFSTEDEQNQLVLRRNILNEMAGFSAKLDIEDLMTSDISFVEFIEQSGVLDYESDVLLLCEMLPLYVILNLKFVDAAY
jgi:hypothetical protein